MPHQVQVTFPVPVDGERLDFAPHECPTTALRLAQNMVLRDGEVGTRPGLESFASNVGAKVIAVLAYGGSRAASSVAASDTVLVMTTAGWEVYNGGAWTDLGGGLIATVHGVFRIFDRAGTAYIVGTNNIDVLKEWDGAAGAISTVPNDPPIARCMAILGDRLILMGLQANGTYSGAVGPQAFATSDQNDFRTGYSTVLFGRLDDTPGDIVAAMERGNLEVACYKSDSVVAFVAQSGTVPFRPEPRVFNCVGPANQRSVVAIGDGSHIFLGADAGVYRYDGVNVTPLPGYIRKSIMKRADPALLNIIASAWGYYNPLRNEVEFFYKGLGSISTVQSVIINMGNLSCWPQSYTALGSANPVSAGGMVQIAGDTMPRKVLFYNTTGVSLKEGDYRDNAQILSATIRSPLTDFGYPGMKKTLRELEPRFQFGISDIWLGEVVAPSERTLGVTIAMTAENGNLLETAEIGQQITLDSSVTTPENSTSHRVKSDMFGFEYSGNATWRYRGCTVRAALRSER